MSWSGLMWPGVETTPPWPLLAYFFSSFLSRMGTTLRNFCASLHHPGSIFCRKRDPQKRDGTSGLATSGVMVKSHFGTRAVLTPRVYAHLPARPLGRPVDKSLSGTLSKTPCRNLWVTAQESLQEGVRLRL